MDPDRLMNLKWVASEYEISCRQENLSWTHHHEAAARKDLSFDERQTLLKEAGESGWTVAQLRNAAKAYIEIKKQNEIASEVKDEPKSMKSVPEHRIYHGHITALFPNPSYPTTNG